MFSEDRKQSSPRFRKLHFPVGLWINSPKKHFAKLGRRWPSAGSVKSTTSSDAASAPDVPSAGISGTFHFQHQMTAHPEHTSSNPPSSSLSISTPSLASHLPPLGSSPTPPSFLRSKPAGGVSQPRHKRLSHLFQRGRSNSDRERQGGERERVPEAVYNPPGLIKIYADALSTGANYKSVLATKASTAGELIVDFISRYGHVLQQPTSSLEEPEGENEEGSQNESGTPGHHRAATADDFVLCDVIGRSRSEAKVHLVSSGWVAECRRALSGSERPLLLMEMWRPKEGFERRFEIRRRDDFEREERERLEKERKGEANSTADVNAQARRFRAARTRMASGSGGEASREPPEKTVDLRRSISDMNLSIRRRHGNSSRSGQGEGDRKNVKSMLLDDGEAALLPKEADGNRNTERELERGEEGEGGTSDLELLSQSLILPPTDRPYFLLLQGYDEKKDFVLYIMSRSTHIFGRTMTAAERQKEREGAKNQRKREYLQVDTFLSAPDILPWHLLVRRGQPLTSSESAVIRPFRGGVVTHNGAELLREAELNTGDIIGLGKHFFFLYKDPTSARPSVLPWLPQIYAPPNLSGAFCCGACGRSIVDRQAALRDYLQSREPILRYHPKFEEQLLKEIVEKNDSLHSEGGALAPAYLLALCIDHSSRHLAPSHLPVLLLKTANLIKSLVLEKIKEIGDKQPENQQDSHEVSTLSIEAVTTELQPLMFWMSNATELLNFIQLKVQDMEKDWEFENLCDPALSADLEMGSEALTLLDDVIMYTFQQCVYYLTKTLYSALPALLDSNPFSSKSSGDAPDEDLSSMPPGVARVLEVYRSTLDLTRTCQLHPDLVSQTFGYLFFFSNASLFNTLMERGSSSDLFFSWSRAVQIRTNLDLVLDWLQGAGLGDIANEFFRKLSITVNFLCIPKTLLIQSSWSTLQEDYPLLSPTQLNHLLQHYKLGPAREPPASWAPPEGTNLTTDIFESFLDHPPLILPSEVSQLQLSVPIPSEELYSEVQRVRTFLWNLEQESLPANQRIHL
ncbi:ras-interacting protein 1 [Polypterus senegalus]|uniref:ras-interacting protein 1 n=1 Tax=Polypterus senegalus TaxID=55291 RepID=UPI001964D239|nr:ras-interacting protein 1 [Polypterus senegalus]